MGATPFRQYESVHEVLRTLALGTWGLHADVAAEEAEQRISEIRHSEARLRKTIEELKEARESLRRQRAGEIRLDALKMPQPDKDPRQAEGAVIEFVETKPLPGDHPGVMKPDTIRINGMPVLVPKEDFLSYEMTEDALVATVRMYARRTVIGEAL